LHESTRQTVKKVAGLLKTSRVQVRKIIQNGGLAAVRVGREYRIPLEGVKDFINNNCIQHFKQL